MSEYGEGAVRLLEVMGVDAEQAVLDLMDKLCAVEAFANGRVEELQQEVGKLKANHKAHLELIDEVAAQAEFKVECRSCNEYYVMDYELSLFDPEHSYCGKSEWCCP